MMPHLLSVAALAPQPGPDPLDLLAHLCATTTGDITLLHSAAGESHSVLAFDPLITLEIDSGGTPHLRAPFDLPLAPDLHPFTLLEHLIAAVPFTAPHPLIGWLGFISYDIGRTLETIPPIAPDELHWPLLRWTLFRHYLLHHPQSRQWTPVAIASDPAPLQDLLRQALSAESSPPPPPQPIEPLGSTPAPAFRATVNRVKEYIAAGDIYQANLAQHWQIPTTDAPHDIYRRLCASSPAPYAGFLRFTSSGATLRHVLSASPELFLNLTGNRILTRPIKGTRRRDLADPVQDARLREELLTSEKDQAELAMIVDLMRNDLGKVSQFGSVTVEAPRDMEPHPTVWHTVAAIASTIRADAGLADLLGAVCPGGSITGAPKIRAMQIIEALEGFRRGLYCGNIGVIGPQAKTLTLNIAIRTILLQAGHAHVYAGGGIVADSNPQLEYEETLDKAAALFRALDIRS